MVRNTTVLEVEDKLVELFGAATSVPVFDLWPGPATESTCVFLGVHPDAQDILLDQSSEDPVIKAGRRQSQEEYRITYTIWAFRGDVTPVEGRKAKVTAYDIYDDLYDVLVDNVKLGLSSILWAKPGGYERRMYPFRKGWACDLRGFVDVNARLL